MMKSTSGTLTSSPGREKPSRCSSCSIRKSREHAARFKFPPPRNQYLISRALLRRALGTYLQIEAREVRFRTTANGKPELAANSDLRFNLSHTQGATVFAITRHRQVGVDVERIRDDTNAMELAERFFSRPEVEWLQSQPASEQIASFFSCWTAKEAYIKAQGEGLSLPLSSFGVLPVDASASSRLQLRVYDDPEESKRWSMWQARPGTRFTGRAGGRRRGLPSASRSVAAGGRGLVANIHGLSVFDTVYTAVRGEPLPHGSPLQIELLRTRYQ